MEPIALLKNKRIVLAVSGSIAAYKAADLASKLTQAGADIDAVLTTAAQRFITPLTFQALTGRPVYTDLWEADGAGGLPTHIAHVGIAESADLMLIAPATANTLAKLAHGLADDLLSVTALAVRCPLLVAPAMDAGMYEQRATQANVELLKSRGVAVIEPEVGRFASGLTGKGRLPDTVTLIGSIRRALGVQGELAGRHVIVTAGGTREPLDPVRYITNRSSGKQGFALAQAAIDAGASVTLISTTDALPIPVGVELIHVETAQQMNAAVQQAVPNADVLFMAAAVADFRPTTRAEQKIKKSQEDLRAIELVQNPDILLEVKAQRLTGGRPLVCVGFAAESQDLITNATTKLQRKGLDFIVVNDILANDAGFAVDTNRVTILADDGTQTALKLASKAVISAQIIEYVASRIALNDKA
jgi:phosphopantothenoylcysteine decarboxylase / phosphopantothenate---cysteine ligase